MKKVNSVFLILCCLAQITPANADLVDTFIVVGDSNVVARGASAHELPSDQISSNPNVFYHYRMDGVTSNTGISPLRTTHGNYPHSPDSYGFGPEYSLGRQLNHFSDHKIAIIKNGRGSATTRHFLPNSLEYNATLSQFQLMEQYLKRHGDHSKPAGLFLMLGVNDALNASDVENYEPNLRKFIDSIRHDLDAPTLDVFMVQPTGGTMPLDQIIRGQQNIADIDANAFTVAVDSVASFRKDGVHFDSHSTVAIGRTLAQAYIGVPEPPSTVSLAFIIVIVWSPRVRT